MKTWIIACLALLLFLPVWSPVHADDPPGDDIETPDVVEPDDDLSDDADDAPDDGGDVSGEDGEPELNLSEQERVRRLSEASGRTEIEIMNLRNGGSLDGEIVEGTTRGWGQVAKMLGLHPGVLGHGTGDKFYPPPVDDDDGLPELPEIDEDAQDAVTSARERAMQRKAERRHADMAARSAKSHNRGLRGEKRTARENKGKPDDVGGPGKSGSHGKPDHAGKPDNSGKSNASDKSNNAGGKGRNK